MELIIIIFLSHYTGGEGGGLIGFGGLGQSLTDFGEAGVGLS